MASTCFRERYEPIPLIHFRVAEVRLLLIHALLVARPV